MTDDSCRVRHETGNAVRRLVRLSDGSFTDRPLDRSDPDGRQVSEPAPADGIPAAFAVEREARRVALEYIRYAREDGFPWARIGALAGFDPGPAARAFRYAVPDGSGAGWFAWTCPSCRGLVRDYGPELDPHDAEQGHAEGCERFAATVDEWDRGWGDE